MATMGFVMLGLAIVLFEDRRAAGAIQANALSLSDMDAFNRNRLDDLDFVGANLGWKKEGVGSSRQASCGKKRPKEHGHS